MSTLKADKWQQISGFVPQTLVQFVPVSSNPISSVSQSSLVNIGYQAGGFGYEGYAYEPVYNTGVTIGSVAFTPKYNNSTIILHTSHMAMSEKANIADDFRISAFADRSILGWRGSALGYSSFAGNLNAAHFHLHLVFTSWGTTTKTIQLRVDSSGSSQASYTFNGKYNNASAVTPPVQWYLMEFQP
jgi:hypothetical protein